MIMIFLERGMRVRVRREGLLAFFPRHFPKRFLSKKNKKNLPDRFIPEGVVGLNRGALDQDDIYSDEHQVGVLVGKNTSI